MFRQALDLVPDLPSWPAWNKRLARLEDAWNAHMRDADQAILAAPTVDQIERHLSTFDQELRAVMDATPTGEAWLRTVQESEQLALSILVEHRLQDLQVLNPEERAWSEQLEHLNSSTALQRETVEQLQAHWVRICAAHAIALLEQEAIRARLCAALETIPNNVDAVATAITPALLDPAATGKFQIPLVPGLFASLAIAIERIGISQLCRESLTGV
jgi:hypothetical protein